jgi:ferric-dicitrate binding protein FerR (iron transport regulator)
MAFKKDITKIIARQLMFSASEDEKALLRKWRSKEEANEKGYQTMKRMLKPVKSRKETADGEVPVDAFFNRTRIIQMGQRTLKWWKVAASVAAILALASVMSQLLYLGDNTRIELVAESGQRTEAVLPDGSHVWLNNCSRLVYEHRFGRRRSVRLEGEAFFDVAKDVTSPFFVEAGDMKVRVTGTEFNVRNYENESTTEVTLAEGAVNVRSTAGQKAKMQPGETISLTKSSGRMVRKKADAFDHAAWRQGVLVFDDTDFDNLIIRLERWYDIEIEYDSDDFKGIHYTGTVRKLRLDQVFDFINLTLPIEVQMKSNHIVLTKK